MDGALLITLFTALLFALSTANYNGYLVEIGVETSFIFRSSHQILYNALFVVLTPLLKFFLWSFFGLGMLRVLATFYSTTARDFYKLRKFLVKVRRKFRFKYVESKSELWVNDKMDRFRLMPAFLFSLFLLFFLSYAEHKGKEEAKKTILKLQEKGYEQHELITIKGYESELFVISCGINNCAAITIDNMEVVYFENKYSVGIVNNVIKNSKVSS